MKQVRHENVIQLERTVMNVNFPSKNGETREVVLLELELASGGTSLALTLKPEPEPEP